MIHQDGGIGNLALVLSPKSRFTNNINLKCLYDQLRICSIPDDHKIEINTVKRVRRAISSYSFQPLHQAGTGHCKQITTLPWGGWGGWGAGESVANIEHPQLFSVFLEGLASVLPHTEQ